VRRWSLLQLTLTVIGGAVVWLLLASVCMSIGSTGRFGWPRDVNVFADRREHVLVASLVGAALAAAGVAYQAVLRNPLADPYLLGVSSGASLAAYVWRFSFMSGILTVAGAMSQQAFAFVGAIVAVGVVFQLASRRGRIEPITLLLVGVIVNAVNASIFLFIDAVYKNLPSSGSPLTFLVGGIQTNLTKQQEISAGIAVGVGWIILLYVSGELNVAGLSEAEAKSLGVRIHRLRWIALVVASLVTAAGVAISGPIGFVGLVCPHIARLVVGNDQRRLLPIATALGAGLLALADAVSRRLLQPDFAQTLMPVGVLTGLLGGPFFLLLLWQNRRTMED
jgi:iron complex transport system permease protein